ncbi:hypothetical protein PAEPH01_2482, partial [Pancytospora epiphaga]
TCQVKNIFFRMPMLQQHLNDLNQFLKDPINNSVFDVFDRDGYIRFNMLYVSPIALCHFWKKLTQYNIERLYFRENELVFEFSAYVIKFKGVLSVYVNEKIYSLELDFDPVINDNQYIYFLRDIEMFLKKCDSCFFMVYNVDIDSEILSNQLGRSISYLLNRK